MRIKYVFFYAILCFAINLRAQRTEILDFISDSHEPNAKFVIQILDISQEPSINLDEVIIKLLENRVKTIVVSLDLEDYNKSTRLDSLLKLHYLILRTSDNFIFDMKKLKRCRNKVAYKFPKRVIINDPLPASHCAVQAALSYNRLMYHDILELPKDTEFYIDYDGGPCFWSFHTIPFSEFDDWKQWMGNTIMIIADFKRDKKYMTPFDEFIFYDYMNESPYGNTDFHCRDNNPGMPETYILGHMINTLLTNIPRDTQSIIVKKD
ncbi:MAG: hypothetical protein ABJG41_16165 [Cyclobacteriaceae bacterium]